MFIDFLHASIEFLIQTIGALGYFGIFILMAFESSIIPVPSEAVLIPAGVLVTRGEQSILLLFIFSTLGSIVGSLASYYIALFLGRRVFHHLISKYGKVIFISESSLERTEKFFSSHGEITIFVGRLLPVIRHLISLPAGFARMNVGKFTFYTILGAGIWNLVLIYLGIAYGNNADAVNQNLGAITLWTVLIVGIFILAYFIRLRLKR
ncbi:DedA family protein [Candidatus Pacearchaeota archaeon]|nr:DedA family protein [Candidatus Pacearchaeota archaeon]